MDSWKRFAETSLPDKKTFYTELYLENITDEGYTHVKKSISSDTLLLADVFANFTNKCIEIYKLILPIF